MSSVTDIKRWKKLFSYCPNAENLFGIYFNALYLLHIYWDIFKNSGRPHIHILEMFSLICMIFCSSYS